MVQDRSPPRPTSDASGLRLHALDHEDLALVSAILQDALIRVGDLAYLPGQRRFALVSARFDWAAEAEGRLERCKAGLHFEGVQRVRLLRVAHDQPETVLELLAVTFEPGPEAPSGVVKLVFAGGAAIQLDVECVEAQMRDIGPRWAVKTRPSHDLGPDTSTEPA
jgi:hypothetical protein